MYKNLIKKDTKRKLVYKKYCINCGKITDYNLDINTGHSYCSICSIACGVRLTKDTRKIVKELNKCKKSEKELKEELKKGDDSEDVKKYKNQLINYLKLRNKQIKLNEFYTKKTTKEISNLIKLIKENNVTYSHP